MKPQAGITPWPDLMVNLRKTRQIELTDIHPQHVVCAWLGNSEDVAKKHYLKVTDGHMAAGCLVSACQKAGLSVTAMPSHAVSAKSQTLENKAYHVMSYHDMPSENDEWAMRDSNFCRILQDLDRFVLNATQNPTHICTRRLWLSSSNCFSHC